jgi:hypothetical protein
MRFKFFTIKLNGFIRLKFCILLRQNFKPYFNEHLLIIVMTSDQEYFENNLMPKSLAAYEDAKSKGET